MQSTASTARIPGLLSLDTVAPEEVARVSSIAWRRVADAWHLDNASAAVLIAVSPRTWARIRAGGWTGRLNQDQLLRVSALIGLYKGLHLYFGAELADRWPSLPNTGPAFGGETPIRTMLEGGLPRLLEVRDHVDALRGGA